MLIGSDFLIETIIKQLFGRPNKALIDSRVKVTHHFIPQIVVDVVAIGFAKLGACVPFETYLESISTLASRSGGSQGIRISMGQRVYNVKPSRAVRINNFQYADNMLSKEEGGSKFCRLVILLLVSLMKHVDQSTNVLGIQYVAATNANKGVLLQHIAIHEIIVNIRRNDKGTVAQTQLGSDRRKDGRGLFVNDMLNDSVR